MWQRMNMEPRQTHTNSAESALGVQKTDSVKFILPICRVQA